MYFKIGSQQWHKFTYMCFSLDRFLLSSILTLFHNCLSPSLKLLQLKSLLQSKAFLLHISYTCFKRDSKKNECNYHKFCIIVVQRILWGQQLYRLNNSFSLKLKNFVRGQVDEDFTSQKFTFLCVTCVVTTHRSSWCCF